MTGGTSLNPLGPGGHNSKPAFHYYSQTYMHWLQQPPTLSQNYGVTQSIQASRRQGHYETSNQTNTASSPRMSLTVQPDLLILLEQKPLEHLL